MCPTSVDLANVVRSAEARRTSSREDRRVNVWRILNGAVDGAPPGVTLDRYAGWLVLAAREELGAETARVWASAAIAALAPEGLVLKTLRKPASRTTSEILQGVLPSAPIEVMEEDAIFLCDLNGGVSTGLYLDQRDTRLLIRTYARDSEVLNLFAYTCAFSVHAGLAGARRVTSVDVSRKALRRGRENMERSGLDPDRHRWFSEDVLRYLGRAGRTASTRFGLVIVDPPVLGRAGNAVFALERDLPTLLDASVQVVDTNGVWVVSTHANGVTEASLRRMAMEAGRGRGRRVDVLEELGLPAWDHPTSADGGGSPLDRGEYLKTLVLRVG